MLRLDIDRFVADRRDDPVDVVDAVGLAAFPALARRASWFAVVGCVGSPLVVFAVVIVLVELLRRRSGHGGGIVAGIVAGVGALLVLRPLILVHLFHDYRVGLGDHVFGLGVAGLLFGGGAFAIVGSILWMTAPRPAPLPVARLL